MALQDDRASTVLLHLRETNPLRCTEDRGVVLQDYTIVNHCDSRVGTVRTVSFECWSGVDDVLHVPLTRFTHSVGQGARLFVDRAGLTVGVSLVVVAIQYLYLLHALLEDARVTS